MIRKLRNIGALWCAPITGKTVQQETKSPLVDFVQWVAYWQNRIVLTNGLKIAALKYWNLFCILNQKERILLIPQSELWL
eukprot:COSAG01_NODE_1120_length_11632_cov_50.655770_8_plen_80_part_00